MKRNLITAPRGGKATRRYKALIAALTVLLGAACEREAPSEVGAGRVVGSPATHEAFTALDAYLEAFVYGDAKGAFSRHVASSGQSVWCESERFAAALAALRTRRDEASCQAANAVTEDRAALEELDAQQQLMMQTLRFLCEQPEGSCRDYAERVYRSSLASAPLWRARPTAYHIEAIKPEGARGASAYVTLKRGGGGERALRELIVLERLEAPASGASWRVQRGLEEMTWPQR